MTVKVVTDSTCDIPPQLMQDLGIAVVPIYVVFGDKSYRDKLDIGDDEFYERLIHGPVHPSTSIPTPKDFADVYNKLAQETDEIISIHITSKESGTYNAALLAKELVTKKCRIEVVDSLSMSMALGLLVAEAGRQAKAGASLEKVTEFVRQAIPKVASHFSSGYPQICGQGRAPQQAIWDHRVGAEGEAPAYSKGGRPLNGGCGSY